MTIEEVKRQLEELITDRRSLSVNVFDGEPDKRYDKDIEALKIARDAIGKTAHWDINVDGYYPYCSHCGEAAQRMSPFCPNCGAKMTTRRHGE